jgi:hypothetical protein
MHFTKTQKKDVHKRNNSRVSKMAARGRKQKACLLK